MIYSSATSSLIDFALDLSQFTVKVHSCYYSEYPSPSAVFVNLKNLSHFRNSHILP